ncbi:MAG: methionine--tRNA ligase [Metamycoplasmataceae bacterium]
MNKKTLYISTPIFYPSGNLHLGHLYSTTIAWAYANFKKKLGYETFFVTGSDEHGQKIENKAIEHKISPQEYVDNIYNEFQEFWVKSKINYDFFSRTTNNNHKNLIQNVFSKMLEKGYIYKSFYEGLYSVQDEEFITEKDAVKIDGKFYHPISKHQLQLVKESSFFFKMSKFKNFLIDYVEKNHDFIKPNKIWKELEKNFLDNELKDLSITRTTFKWGIPINEEKEHIIYVWLDALFNYLSALDFNFNYESEKFLKFWKNGDEIIHVVGKEITRFHCIYWPIFLHSLDIKLPTQIIAHGWLITNSGKMSKSKGNVINPLVLFKEYDSEIIKYYLLSHLNIFDDSIFDLDELKLAYNADLANNIGNLISRTIKMIKNNFQKPISFDQSKIKDIHINIFNLILETKNNFIFHFNNFEINKAYKSMLYLSNELNKYIDLTTPWLLTDNLEQLELILNLLLNGIYSLLSYLEIVMPNFVAKFKLILNIESFDFFEIDNFGKFNNIIVNDNNIIFERRK